MDLLVSNAGQQECIGLGYRNTKMSAKIKGK
jgi:hypothetical protein